MSHLESLSAVTLAVTDMARAVRFYDALGFEMRYGGGDSEFTSYQLGDSYLNLQPVAGPRTRSWGRVIIHVTDVDAMHERVLQAGATPAFGPRDAPWGERYFHVRDPDGHELSFARPLED